MKMMIIDNCYIRRYNNIIILKEWRDFMKKIKKNKAASWCCEASTVVDIKKMIKKVGEKEKK